MRPLLHFLNYRIVSRVFGVILIFAGAMKYYGVTRNFDRSQVLLLIAGGFELLLGIWLWIGYLPGISRLVSMGCLYGFIHLSLSQVMAHKVSCGCFGPIDVNPWIVLIIDCLALFFMSASIIAEDLSSINRPWMARSFWLATTIIVAVTLAAFFISPSPKSSSYSSKSTVGQIVDAYSTNYDKIPGLDVRFRLKVKDLTVSKVERRVAKTADGGTITTVSQPMVEVGYRYRVQGPDVRRDPEPADRLGASIIVLRRTHALQLIENKKRAWLRSDFAIETDPADSRLLGFSPPISSYGEWLRNGRIYDSQILDGGETLVLTIHDEGDSLVKIVATAQNRYLPKLVTYFYSDGSIRSNANITYQEIPTIGSLFPANIVRRHFAAGVARETSSKEYHSEFEYQIQKDSIALGSLPQQVFDLELPEKTLVSYSGGNRRMVKSTPVSSFPPQKTDALDLYSKSAHGQPPTAQAWIFTIAIWIGITAMAFPVRHWARTHGISK